MTFGLDGSMTMEFTAILERKSPKGDQEAPRVGVFQIPPATPAAYMVEGVVGWISRVRTRPPMFPGPRLVQLERTVFTLAISPGPDACAAGNCLATADE